MIYKAPTSIKNQGVCLRHRDSHALVNTPKRREQFMCAQW